MNARKLPSGSWRARLFLGEDENGKKHYKSFTAATKREAERLALNYAEERATPDRITFKDALTRYIESKSNVLSRPPCAVTGRWKNITIQSKIWMYQKLTRTQLLAL